MTDDLEMISAVQYLTSQCYGSVLSADERAGLVTLGKFLLAKCVAIDCRLAGNISSAIRNENLAETQYDRLPEEWRG